MDNHNNALCGNSERGSAVNDIILTIDVVKTLISRDHTRLHRKAINE